MQNIIRFIILSIILILAFFSHAGVYANLQTSTYSYKQISYENGLPGLNIRDIHQDKTGVMWISIESVGLCKYNGHTFKLYQHNYNNKHSLSSNYVNKIDEDSTGNLWIATDYGLNMFQKQKNQFKQFFHYPEQNNSLSDNICLTVLIDSKNNVIVGTENGLSVKKSGQNAFEQHLNKNGTELLNKISVHAIFEGNNHNYWLGTSKGLIKFDLKTGNFRQFYDNKQENNLNLPLPHTTIDNIISDNYGYLWIVSQNGIKRFDINKEAYSKFNLHSENNNPENINESVNELMIDNNGKLWAGTSSNGIIIIDPKTLKHIRINKESTTKNPIKSKHVQSIFQDKIGQIWIGTKFEGLFMLNTINKLFEWPLQYDCLNSLNNKYILSINALNDQNIWIGTKDDGLFKVNCKTGSIINYTPETATKLNSFRVQYIYHDSINNLWVGTDKGLCYYNNTNSQFIECGNHSVNWICEDRTKRIWLGTNSGVFVVEQTTKTPIRFHSEINPEFFTSETIEITNIYRDRNNTMWFATRNGPIYKYSLNDDRLKTFPKELNNQANLPKLTAQSFHEDQYGNLWIGTKSNGLLLIENKTGKISKFNMQNGLPGNMIMCIEEDNNDHLWLGTNNGISSFNIKNSNISNYTSHNGLASNISEPAASYLFNSGDLFFGGFNGFNVFTPSKLDDEKYELSPTINSVQLDDTTIFIDNHHKDPIIVNHKNQSIRFNFSLADYRNPSMHNYFVMLEGTDNKWHNIGSQNMISYSNLYSGSYIFKIKAKNEANTTSNITTLKFEIEKSFYQLLAFKTFITILIILAFAFLVYTIKKRQGRLKRVITERTQKLEVAYKELLNKNTYIREQNRQIERHQNNLERKVAERTHDLEIAKQRAEESDRLKSAFLANMSHEIRTPLNAITGFSTLVINESSNTERKQKYVNIIKSNTASLLKLVEDILDISKIEAKQLKIENKLFEINSVVIDINTIFQKEIVSKKGSKVKLLLNKTSAPNSSIFFYSDPVRIKQIIENLLSNAIKFTHSGKIELGFKVNKKSILFWVSDTGIGIKTDDLESIFNRFTKIESDDAIYRGTGLGLSISRSLVEMLDGQIWVESEINKGSTFYFELPGDIDIRNQTNEKPSATSYNIDLSGKNILIVEDERSNYILVQSFLTKTGAKLTWAHNGNIAIEHCQTTKYDIILMDIRMPVLDGYETLRQIRKTDTKVPIIAQTAYATPDEKEKITHADFNDLIVKPYSKNDILKKIVPYIY